MSANIALAATGRMNMAASLVAPMKTTVLAAAMQQLHAANSDEEQLRAENSRTELLKTYGYSGGPTNSKPFAFAAGLAFIPIHGALINRFGQSWGYVTGYNFIRAQVDAAVADPDVMGLVFDVNSYGGEAAGCFELAADIAASRAEKPSLAVVDSSAYSAGYALASSASKIAVTPSGGVGSIGVIAMHVDMSKMLDKYGIQVSLIFAGDHKADGNPFESLPDNVRGDIQTSIDKSYTKFTTLVAENRGLDVQTVIDTQAQTYDAEDALALGLIDVVATPAQAVAAFFNELSGSNTQGNSMGNQATSQSGAEGATTATNDAQLAEARKAERERMSGIMSCEEAKDKAGLANHLALNTELSVDAAKAILKAAAPEKSAAAPTAAAAKADEPNPFAAAMDASGSPNVGADAGNEATAGQKSAGSRILADYAAATGVKLQ